MLPIKTIISHKSQIEHQKSYWVSGNTIWTVYFKTKKQNGRPHDVTNFDHADKASQLLIPYVFAFIKVMVFLKLASGNDFKLFPANI